MVFSIAVPVPNSIDEKEREPCFTDDGIRRRIELGMTALSSLLLCAGCHECDMSVIRSSGLHFFVRRIALSIQNGQRNGLGIGVCLPISYSCIVLSLSLPCNLIPPLPPHSTDIHQQQERSNSLTKSCAMEEFEACLLLIKSVTDSEELAFASTMQDLSFACR